jgi:hypothetical protein
MSIFQFVMYVPGNVLLTGGMDKSAFARQVISPESAAMDPTWVKKIHCEVGVVPAQFSLPAVIYAANTVKTTILAKRTAAMR